VPVLRSHSRALAACLLALVACGGPEPPRAGPPSIVLITADTLRQDRLGAYGYFRDTSPALDRLAEEGVLFERALTPISVTLPAHVSLMTSTLPLRHGIKGNLIDAHQRFEGTGGLRTFAQMLRDAGYTTAAFISAAPVKRHSGLNTGFDHFDEPEASERRADATTARAVAWLENGPPSPLLLWVHYFDPHKPYDPPESHAGLFSDTGEIARYMRARGAPGPFEAERIWRDNNHYDAEVRFMSDQIGVLFDTLRDLGIWENAAVVFVSDHGEGLGQHAWIGHGTVYNETILLPLIIKLPAALGRAGERHPNLTSLIDVVPTLAVALDLPLRDEDRAQLDGVDALAAEPQRTQAYAERVEKQFDPRLWSPGRKYALTEGSWKYFHLTEGRDQLFDLANDPFELRDVFISNPDVARRMREQLFAILASPTGTVPDAPPLPDAIRRQLEELGYLE
jgi:arylsulfatase A-like enzyme